MIEKLIDKRIKIRKDNYNMDEIVSKLKSNDKVQNNLALYYFFEYGKQTLKDDYAVSKIKSQIKENNPKNSILNTEYIFETIEIAKQMADLSVKDFKDYIYNSVKEERKQERGR